MASLNDIEKMAQVKSQYRKYCKFGSSRLMLPKMDFIVCNHCGRRIYKNYETKKKYDFRESFRKAERKQKDV